MLKKNVNAKLNDNIIIITRILFSSIADIFSPKIPFTLNDNNKEVKLVMKNNKIELPPKTSNKKEYNIPIIILSLITFFLISKKNMI